MRKPEILARIGKEAVLVYSYGRPRRVVILDYGYVKGSWSHGPFKTKGASGVLVQGDNGRKSVVRGQNLIGRDYDEYMKEYEAEEQAEREREREIQRQRLEAYQRGKRLVELLGCGSVSNWGHASGQVTIPPNDVPKLIDKLEQELMNP